MNLKHEMWLCPEKRTKKSPTGTQADPYPVTTREQFDGLLAKSVAKGQELHLYPGLYLTRGCWAHNEVGPMRIFGHGPNSPTIALAITPEELPIATYNGEKIRRPDVAILTTRPGPIGRSYFENLNLVAPVSAEILVTGGLNCEGSMIARNVTVQNIRGQWAAHARTGLFYEAFGIRTFGARGGSLIEGCDVILMPDAYGNGITIGHVPNFANPELGQPDPSLVSRCTVNGTRKGHCGFTASANTRIVDCEARNVNHCIYQDTAGARNIIVENFDGMSHWAFIRLHSHNERENYEGITVRNSTVFFSLIEPNKDCIALALTHTGDPSQFDGIDVDVRVLNTPGNYYAVSSSLPQPNLRYQLQDHKGTGRINLPAWSLPKAKSKAKAAAGPIMPAPINPRLRHTTAIGW